MGIATQVEALWNGLIITDGTPLEGGKVYSYEAGTSTPKILYTAQDKSEEATNPLILDSAGRAKVWGDGNYKLIITDQNDVAYLTIDGLVYGKESVKNTWCGLSTGGPNDFIVGATPPIESLTNGDVFSFIANDTNTSDGDPDIATLKINSLAARTIKTTAGEHIAAGDIDAGAIITVIYNLASDTFILDLGSLTPAYSDVTISSLTATAMVASDANKKLISKTPAEARTLMAAAESPENSDITDLLKVENIGDGTVAITIKGLTLTIDVGSYDLKLDGETAYPSVDLGLNMGKSDKRYYTLYTKNLTDNGSAVLIGSDIGLGSTRASYSGDGVTEGDFRQIRSGNDWIFQRRESNVWKTKLTVAAAATSEVWTVLNNTALRSIDVTADMGGDTTDDPADISTMKATIRYLLRYVGTLAEELKTKKII